MWTILLIESMEKYRVGPEGAMVGGGYDAALEHPLGSLVGRRTLETMLVARGGHSHFHGMLGVVNQGTETFDSLEPPPSSEESKGSPALLIKTKAQPVPKGPPRGLIEAIVATKKCNPTWGCPRIVELIPMCLLQCTKHLQGYGE